MNCSVYNSFNITWYHDNHRINQGNTYTIFESVVSNKNVSVLIVSNLNCQMAGNYTCVAANEYGSDQRQFTLKILGKCCKAKRVKVFLMGNVLSSISFSFNRNNRCTPATIKCRDRPDNKADYVARRCGVRVSSRVTFHCGVQEDPISELDDCWIF